MITALTTTFPGGQLPNFIDKMVTALIVYLMIKAMASLKNDKLKMAIIGLIGTAISGTVFLGSALFIVGLPLHLWCYSLQSCYLPHLLIW